VNSITKDYCGKINSAQLHRAQERAAMNNAKSARIPNSEVGVTVLWTMTKRIRCVVTHYDETRYQLRLLRDGGTVKAGRVFGPYRSRQRVTQNGDSGLRSCIRCRRRFCRPWLAPVYNRAHPTEATSSR